MKQNGNRHSVLSEGKWELKDVMLVDEGEEKNASSIYNDLLNRIYTFITRVLICF